MPATRTGPTVCEDQASRMAAQQDHRDAERRQHVRRIRLRPQPLDPTDKLNAALVLQHTGVTCDGALRSESAENYLLAHYLAMSVSEAGEQDATTLVAQNHRSLPDVHRRAPEVRHQSTGRPGNRREYLPPIDRTVTDAERGATVPPLQALLARYRSDLRLASPGRPGQGPRSAPDQQHHRQRDQASASRMPNSASNTRTGSSRSRSRSCPRSHRGVPPRMRRGHGRRVRPDRRPSAVCLGDIPSSRIQIPPSEMFQGPRPGS